MRSKAFGAGHSLAFAGKGTTAYAQTKNYGPGVTDNEIKIGHSAPFSGPASAFGIYSRVEEELLPYAGNDKGGINGRKLKFIALDNGFNPPRRRIEGSKRLVEEGNVLAEVGTVGTPTNSATQRYLNGKKVPQLLISAGGSKFRRSQAVSLDGAILPVDPRSRRWATPSTP